MTDKANVTLRGAVQLGAAVACDAFDETRPLRVVTHAHADHTMGLQQSFRTCEKILMTEATRDLLGVMRDRLSHMPDKIETPSYGKSVQCGDEKITFFPADHILGAAQILVEDTEGIRTVFTGDFRIEDTPVLETDTLVMEATYGSPVCKRAFDVDIRQSLVSLTEKGLKDGSVYVFGYHGKLQEIMAILHAANVNVPFVASERIFQLSKVCQKHGMSLGNLVLSTEPEPQQLLLKRDPCVIFCHMNTLGYAGLDDFRITVSGWEFSAPVRQKSKNDYVVALSDHSDFGGLLEYVKRSRPKKVITDNYRVGHAETFASEIRKRLGIDASALPLGGRKSGFCFN